MLRVTMRLAAIAAVLFPLAAVAEPVKLKLAFLLSDRTSIYVDMIKPFVDAVNEDGRDQIEIQVYSSGALSKVPAQQAQLVLDGVADIALVIPSSATAFFHDNAVVELPGLFRGCREASMVFTRLVAANALKGYEDFYVIGSFATEPESIHVRAPITALADLKGLKIRSSSPLEAAALAKLGMQPVILPATAASEAISDGVIEGAAIAPALLPEFGIGRLTNSHYLLPTSTGTLSLLMNRKRFESLPETARAVIRKYSGEWAASRFADGYEKLNAQVVEHLKSDSRRKAVIPSPSDLEQAQAAFEFVTEQWVAKNPHHRELLQLTNSEIVKFRSMR
jgi:TRAP-type C4-dicarboxylate transport system substrate-binding protein